MYGIRVEYVCTIRCVEYVCVRVEYKCTIRCMEYDVCMSVYD